MKKSAVLALILAASLSSPANASNLQLQPDGLRVSSQSFESGDAIPPRFAFCQPDGLGRTRDGGNVNPQISWEGAPQETKSFVLMVVDPDVPRTFELANQPGKVLAEHSLRQDFYHWVLINIPPEITSLPEGIDSKGITPGGKPVGVTDYGLNASNDYSKMGKGSHGGYDGPCPPWNDERLHHYHFVVYALNVATLNLSKVTGVEVAKMVQNHTIAKGEFFGTFTNNAMMIPQ